jgi:cholesterol 7-dehydrogenase
MGAHLGEGGIVRYDTCIECPFHGWTFDGETGGCVLSSGKNRITRSADRYEYYDIEKCSPVPNNDNTTDTYLQKVTEQEEIKIKKYSCREMNGSILVWYHSDEKLRENPIYEPFDVSKELKINKMEGKRKKKEFFKKISSI